MTRSFGIEATDDLSVLTSTARAVLSLGYERLWFNDTPFGDGLRSARIVLDAEPMLKVGVGVIAVDRWTPHEVAEVVDDSLLDRITLGVGAGYAAKPTSVVAEWLDAFRQLAPRVEIAVAAMGPSMCRFASRSADVVLLNWMTPERIRWAREQMDHGSKARIASYVRVAVGEGAEDRLRDASALYAALPHYARHFAAMGEDPGKVGIASRPGSVGELIAAYDEVLDETVIRAVPIPGDEKSVMEIAEAAAL